MNDPATFTTAAYRIITPRLELRCWEPADAAVLQEVCARNRDHLAPHMHWAKGEPTAIDAKLESIRQWRGDFDHGRNFDYGVFEIETGELIGATRMHASCGRGGLEFGYWIDRAHCKQGYATEACAGMTRTAFEVLGVQRAEIRTDPENAAGKRVPEKLGFEYEGVLRGRTPRGDGKLADTLSFCLTAGGYLESSAVTWSIEAYDALRRRVL